VRTIHANPAAGHLVSPADPESWRQLWRLRQALRDGAYDLVIDAQGLLRSAVIARLAGAPVAGYDRRSVREAPAALAYRHRTPVARRQHAVLRIRQLLGSALAYSVDKGGNPPTRLSLPVLPRDRSVFLLHGTSAENKKWPDAHWIGLAKAAATIGLSPVTTWSSDAERRLAEAIGRAEPATRIIARTSITAIATAIARATLVVGVDTGLAHLADVAGVPTLMLFQASNPEMTGPTGGRSRALVPAAGVPERAARRAAHRPIDPSRVVPLEEVVHAMARLAGGPA
jgi:heptosyltransferase-1